MRPLVLSYLATVSQADIAEVSSLAAQQSRKAGLGMFLFCENSVGEMSGMCTAGLIFCGGGASSGILASCKVRGSG